MMYPHPLPHSYLQRCASEIPRGVLNRMINKAMVKDIDSRDSEPPFLQLTSNLPRCFAPHVDVTRAKCGFGRRALPKLRRELHSERPLIVRQAVCSIADHVKGPEGLAEAVKLRIPDRLTDLLVSDDTFLRERVAMIYASMAGQAIGRDAILANASTVCNLARGLQDPLDAVRIRIAEAIEILARNSFAAEDLCTFGFVDLIVDRITYEKKHILVVHLETLKSLLDRDMKIQAIQNDTMEKLVILLQRKDEGVLSGSLACLAILCQENVGKQKALDMDLLFTLKTMLDDERRPVHTKAASAITFITTTTPGKLRALELRIMGRLLELAGDSHCRELQLMSMKALTNIAEIPKGRAIMLEAHTMFIEDISTCEDEATERHKQILLETIRWRP